jgi:hypothetical protein
MANQYSGSKYQQYNDEMLHLLAIMAAANMKRKQASSKKT